MKVDTSRLERKLRKLPKAQRRHVADAVKKSADEGARVARVLVPIGETGGLSESIVVEVFDGGMRAEVVAGGDTKRGRIQANTIEGGRDPNTRGGFAAAQPFIGPARSYLAKKFKGRISRAINKAAREVANGG